MIRNAYSKCVWYEMLQKGMISCMDIKDRLVEIRKETGMNRREFAEYFEIPYRTLQDWELGNRQMPEYLLRLIAYKVKMESLQKKEEKNNE